MQTINNFRQLLIAKDIATTATAGTTIASPSTLANGEVAVTDMSNRVLANNTSGLTSLPYVKLVQGQGTDKPLIVSPPIPRSATARAKAYVDYVEQVSFVGYNSATSGIGAFDALSNFGPASPIFRTTFKSNYFEYADKLMEAISGYMPMASDTISTFVDKLTLAMTSEIKKYIYIPYQVERVNSLAAGSVTALTGTATSIVFTKGSSLATINGTITNSGLVGSYMRVGGTGVNNPVYKITNYTASTSIVLDQPFQGPTATVLVANAPLITPVTTTGTAGAGWGIRLTGLLQSKFIANVYRYQMQKWVTTIQNMGTTTVSDYTKANDGVGTWYQIAEEEVFTLFSEGFADNAPIQVPPVTYRQNVVSGATYASIEVYWKDMSYNTTNVSDTAANFKQVKVAGACTYDAVNGDSEFVANSTFYDTGAGEQDVYSVLNAYLTTGVPTQGTFTAL
jgi:hypothetical protein